MIGRNFRNPGDSPLRHQLTLRVAIALAAAVACASVAGVLAARQEASQRLRDSLAGINLTQKD